MPVFGPAFNPEPPKVAMNNPPPQQQQQPQQVQPVQPEQPTTTQSGPPPEQANPQQPAPQQPAPQQANPQQPAPQQANPQQPAPAVEKQPRDAAAQQRAKDKQEAREKAAEEKRQRDEQAKADKQRAKDEAQAKKNSFASAADDTPPEKEKPRKDKPKPSAADCDPILYPEGCEGVKKPKKEVATGKESLSKADILGVVKANKGDISKCVGDQRSKDASKATGIIKMTWSIKQDGRTSGVSVASEEFAGTFVGKCLTRAIQGWKFDAYSGDEMKPITFPYNMDNF